MIVYMSPLQSNSTFFLYSPTILLENKIVELSITFLSIKSEVNQHLASHKISNLTSSINSKIGEIWLSVVRFHLVHSSVQILTWWWFNSPFSLIGTKGFYVGFIDSGALMGQYQ